MLDWHEECYRKLANEINTFINPRILGRTLGRLRLNVDNLRSESTVSPPGSHNRLTATTLEGGRYINILISAGTTEIPVWRLDILYDTRIERYTLTTDHIYDMFDLTERVRVTAECLVRTFLTEDTECSRWCWLDQNGEINERLNSPESRLNTFTKIPHEDTVSGMLINSYKH